MVVISFKKSPTKVDEHFRFQKPGSSLLNYHAMSETAVRRVSADLVFRALQSASGHMQVSIRIRLELERGLHGSARQLAREIRPDLA